MKLNDVKRTTGSLLPAASVDVHIRWSLSVSLLRKHITNIETEYVKSQITVTILLIDYLRWVFVAENRTSAETGKVSFFTLRFNPLIYGQYVYICTN